MCSSDLSDLRPVFEGSAEEWNETLRETIGATIVSLQKAAFAKWGRAQRRGVSVYVPTNILAMTHASPGFKESLPDTSDCSFAPRVGSWGLLDIYINTTLEPDTIRVVALFDVDDNDRDKEMFGNIKVL